MNHRRTGVGIAIAGVISLLTLRIWSSPIALEVTGRSRSGAIAFLAIPGLLLVIGAGIVIALWGDELGMG